MNNIQKIVKTIAILSGLLILVGFENVTSSLSKDKPNIVLILADDLGYGDIGVHGGKQIPTPNIDRLANDGVRFTQAYVSSPVCGPSRAGLITGKNQVSFGLNNNFFHAQPGFDPEFVGLPVEEITLADELKKLGYVNGIIGKWHLGEKEQFYPTNRGFDEFYGFLAGGHDYFIAENDGQNMTTPIECTYKEPKPITYLTNDIGDESVGFIQRHQDEPFFLFASFNAPHGPLQALEEDLELFKHIDDEIRRTYCAMVYCLDKNIGKILNTLKTENLVENTIVVFLSDNGGPVVQPISNGSINAPLRGQKTTVLEGGIRVPFLFKWPSEISGGETVNDMVLSLDIFPTFLRAAGGTITDQSGLRGVDLMPFISGQINTPPHNSMEWKYTVSTAIRRGDWKLIRLPDRMPQLYNISEDISELNDEAKTHPELTRKLLKELGTWDIHLPHPLYLEPPSWRIRHLSFYDKKYQLTQPELLDH